tara:strand:+ start:1532 stop:2260 length:729 start_codon:yes stop_codon:yes gene_type:complete
MKFKLLLITLLLYSCGSNYTRFENKQPYYSKGFAYIYKNDTQSLEKNKMDENDLFISHHNLKIGSNVKLINPENNISITLRNTHKIKYPEFYKILISKRAANKLKINHDLPYIEILEIKKNKSFVAKKAKIFSEEKKLSSNAPVTSVKISNISKNLTQKKKKKNVEINILLASFYSIENAKFLKKRINEEMSEFDVKKLKILKKDKEFSLISGPYSAVNLVKNDYILLKNFGFEELDILVND